MQKQRSANVYEVASEAPLLKDFLPGFKLNPCMMHDADTLESELSMTPPLLSPSIPTCDRRVHENRSATTEWSTEEVSGAVGRMWEG